MQDLAASPDERWFQKNASRKVCSASGLDDFQGKLYWADVPMATEGGTRVWSPLPFCPIFEELISEFKKTPDTIRNFISQLNTQNWAERSLRKELRDQGVDVVPFGLCEDGATYRGKGVGHNDSLEIRYVNILGSRSRKVVVSMPKSRMCGERCGCPCRGMCTEVAIDRVLLWMCEVAASGMYPQARHEGLASIHRRASASQPRAQFSRRALPKRHQVCLVGVSGRLDAN